MGGRTGVGQETEGEMEGGAIRGHPVTYESPNREQPGWPGGAERPSGQIRVVCCSLSKIIFLKRKRKGE